ncbi:hypothetical protein U1Q18_004774 [Sarracenia purpurea var. burkii]
MMKSVTGLSIGTPRVANEGGPELTAYEFRCPEVGGVVTPAVVESGLVGLIGRVTEALRAERVCPSGKGGRILNWLP